MRNRLPLYRSECVRALDAAAINGGVPAYELMCRAGAAALQTLRRHWPQARRVLVVCGNGNNGGDGYVLARLAQQDGMSVTVLALDARAPRSDEARQAWQAWQSLGAVEVWNAEHAGLPAADVVVDALFGIGIAAAVVGPAAGLIEAINRQAAPVLALDVPSGIDADCGSAPGPAVRATVTLSFVGRKRGLYTAAGRAHCGQREFDAIGVESSASIPPDAHTVDPDWLAQVLPVRDIDSHKGRFGHVLAVGGDHGMGGALRLCAEAAMRVGAGLTSAVTRPEHVPAVLAARPECMVSGCDGEDDWPATLASRASVLALGPGLGRGSWGEALYRHALELGRPAVLDADALWHLAAEPGVLPATVLTPHPAEAARLLGTDTATVQADRFAAVRELACRFAACVVLKGAGTLVAAPAGELVVIDAGNPGLASAGSGDVLTGVIAGLLAQGLQPFDAACAGAMVHALAGDACAAADGQRGLLASDLLPAIRRLVNP